MVKLIKKIKFYFCYANYKRRALEVYRTFPFFYLSKHEFMNHCADLQSCGAGIVLGYPKESFEVRIIAVDSDKFSNNRDLSNLPLGHFGEIVFRNQNCPEFVNSSEFVKTKHYGFFDQRGRIWCCGKIRNSIFVNDMRCFPWCIEPLFERLWWVKRSIFRFDITTLELSITIIPRRGLRLLISVCKKNFIKSLKKFSDRFPVTLNIKNFIITTNKIVD